jgi:cytosine/adenosine deaminase-related metal-dependent hydrolase
MIHTCRWLLPIDRPPIERAWIETVDGLIRRFGQGAPPAPPVDLGDVAVLPGLVNAHTHLELSWLAGRVPPAESLDEWLRALLHLRRSGRTADVAVEVDAGVEAARCMHATGTVLVGDVSNNLNTAPVLAGAGLGGVVFHELIGFDVIDPSALVTGAIARLAAAAPAVADAVVPIRLTLAAHAPYSVAPRLLREIATRVPDGPLTIHVAESSDEIEFLRRGTGAFRRLLDDLGAWSPVWRAPESGPVAYLAGVGYLRPGMLAVHGVHLTDRELERLRDSGAALVTCPRSNLWVGAGMPRVSHFYAAGVPVAIGTDSLASVDSLNLFDELAELRRIAPDVTAGSLLESATRIGAEVLGFGASYGTIAAGKAAALIAVDVPGGLTDVEEYLVGGVPAAAVRRVS